MITLYISASLRFCRSSDPFKRLFPPSSDQSLPHPSDKVHNALLHSLFVYASIFLLTITSNALLVSKFCILSSVPLSGSTRHSTIDSLPSKVCFLVSVMDADCAFSYPFFGVWLWKMNNATVRSLFYIRLTPHKTLWNWRKRNYRIWPFLVYKRSWITSSIRSWRSYHLEFLACSVAASK